MRCTERRLTPAALASPVGALARRRPQGQIDYPLNGVGRQWGLARLARLVAQQPFDALRHEPRLPGPHHRLRFTRPAHDLGSAAAVGGGKDNIGAPHVLLWRATIRNDRLYWPAGWLESKYASRPSYSFFSSGTRVRAARAEFGPSRGDDTGDRFGKRQ